jgi:hypothetical protein
MSLDRQLAGFKKDVSSIGAVVYRNLPPEERFRLVVQAEAADDQAEVKRLLETCPKKTYTMRDAAVVERLRAADELGLVVLLELAIPLAKLQMLKAQVLLLEYLKGREMDERCMAWLDGYYYGRADGWRLAGMEGEPPPRWLEDEDGENEVTDGEEALPLPSDEAPEVARFLELNREMTRTLETLVLEQWEAFSLMCREDLELEPETVLEVCMAPALKKVQEALGKMEGIQADPAKVEEHRGILGELWRRLAGLEE